MFNWYYSTRILKFIRESGVSNISSVLRISEAASLGLHSAVLLAAAEGETLSLAKINRILGVSESHLSKVMQRMVKAGLVNSSRGPIGGFSLAKPATEISLLDIYQAIDGPMAGSECLLGKPVCSGKQCILGSLTGKISDEVHEYFANTYVSSLLTVFEGKCDGI